MLTQLRPGSVCAVESPVRYERLVVNKAAEDTAREGRFGVHLKETSYECSIPVNGNRNERSPIPT